MSAAARSPEASEVSRLAAPLISLASQAGAVILSTLENGLGQRLKPDRSPVTAADEAAEIFLLEGLEKLMPGVPVVAEESAARGIIPNSEPLYILVDPVDGTRELVDGRSEYTVNVGIISDGKPVFGVIYAPALAEMFFAHNGKAFKCGVSPGAPFDPEHATPIHARSQPARLTAAISRSHPDAKSEALLGTFPVTERLKLGSSLKFARLAEGAADIYVRLASIHEWDIAAGHAILDAAGGSVRSPDGNEIVYGRPGANYKIDGFVARGAFQYLVAR
jgi:3'(2'), 5'-bisphosphate nucleotidase